MTEPFLYQKYVTGQEFVGRTAESIRLANLLSTGENVLLSEPLHTGKHSLMRQSLLKMSRSSVSHVLAEVGMMALRSRESFATGLGSAVLEAFCPTGPECEEAVAELLGDTHFVFDSAGYPAGGALGTSWDLDDNDFTALFELPYRLAEMKGRRVVVLLDDFDSILHIDDGEHLLDLMEKVLRKEMDGTVGLGGNGIRAASYVFCGSRINAMAGIFAVRKRFFRMFERVRLPLVSETDVIDHVNMYFNASGKVMDRELIKSTYSLLRGNIFYIKLLCSISDGLTRGYVVPAITRSALERMITIYDERFRAVMHDLTNFQMSLLKAVLDGHSKFAVADVIENYGLNSSANVKRLKDALCKKEVISFDDEGRPYVIDPLFEYWVRNKFFKMG